MSNFREASIFAKNGQLPKEILDKLKAYMANVSFFRCKRPTKKSINKNIYIYIIYIYKFIYINIASVVWLGFLFLCLEADNYFFCRAQASGPGWEIRAFPEAQRDDATISVS